MTVTVSTVQRSLAPDLARGIMLLFIAIANVTFFLWGHETTGVTMRPTDGSPFDRALDALASVFIDARIYPMFALLFGYGMVQFLESRWSRGIDRAAISRMLVRRHLWLIAFGAVHALLLFEGDILGAYGLAGLILAPIFLWNSERAMRIGIWVLAGLIAFGMALVAAGAALLQMAVGTSLSGAAPIDMTSTGFELSSAAYANPLVAMAMRMLIWVIATPATVLALTVPLCMLLGMLAARHRWLDGGAARVSLRAAAVIGITVAVAAGIPVAAQSLGVWTVDPLAASAWLTLSQTLGIFGGIGYVALVALLAQRIARPAAGLVRAIAAVGQRSLSFYLLQALIFAPLLSNWGLGLGDNLNVSGAFALAAGVWLLSLLLALLLDRRGARGPAEVLLRCLTYGRFDVQPIVGIR